MERLPKQPALSGVVVCHIRSHTVCSWERINISILHACLVQCLLLHLIETSLDLCLKIDVLMILLAPNPWHRALKVMSAFRLYNNNIYSLRVSVAVINTMAKGNLVRKGFIISPYNSQIISLLKEIRARMGTWRQKPGRMLCSLLSRLPYTTQNDLPQVGTAHSGVDIHLLLITSM